MSILALSGMSMTAILIGGVLGVLGILSFIGAVKTQRGDRLAYMRRQALENNLPIIKVIDLAGFAISVLGQVDDNDSVYFEDKRLSLRVRPSFLDQAEPIIEDGIRTYYYYGKWYYPIGAIGLTCLVDVVDVISKEFPELGFIKDEVALITSICVDDGEDLKYNCGQLLVDFEQEEYVLVYGEPVQETTIEQELIVDDDGEALLDEDGSPQYESIEVLATDANGNPIYKKNPDYLSESKLLATMKKARASMLNRNLRFGAIPMKRAMTYIPGKADGKNLDTIVKTELAKNDMKHASEDKTMRYFAYTAIALCIMVIGVYLIYTLFPAAQNLMGGGA